MLKPLFVISCYIRSFVFYTLFVLSLFVVFLFFSWLLSFFGNKICVAYIRWYLQNVNPFLLRAIVGIKIEVRGLKNISKTTCIIVSKHQSAIETIGIYDKIFTGVSYVLKIELTRLPFAGKLLRINKAVKIDRKRGVKGFIEMLELGKKVLTSTNDPRKILIFPEGTRTIYGKYNAFKGGASKMYEKFNVPLQPVALSTGFFWQSGRFVIYPGVAIIEILPVIEKGLNPDEVMKKAEKLIVEASNKLAKENCPNHLRKKYGL